MPCCASHTNAPAPSINDAYRPPLRNNGSILHQETSVHAGSATIRQAVDVCDDGIVLKSCDFVLDIRRERKIIVARPHGERVAQIIHSKEASKEFYFGTAASNTSGVYKRMLVPSDLLACLQLIQRQHEAIPLMHGYI